MLKAAYLGSYKCITMLWKRGAKLNIWDISDNSPLHAVLSKGTPIYIRLQCTQVTHVTYFLDISALSLPFVVHFRYMLYFASVGRQVGW